MPDAEPRLPWLEAGTAYFAGRLAGADLDRDSALPGWTRRHVVAHVAANARALGRLVHWARTGAETPMYASRQAREEEIGQLAQLAPGALTELAARTAAELRDALGTLSGPRWQARVRTAQGRDVPATEIVWMRCREVWIHGVDLATGGTYEDFPPALIDALLTDVTGQWERAGLTLAPDDRDIVWRAGPDGGEPVELRGSAAALAAWVTGRGPAPDPRAPEIGRWL